MILIRFLQIKCPLSRIKVISIIINIQQIMNHKTIQLNIVKKLKKRLNTSSIHKLRKRNILKII